ncbi:MAG: DUF47 family protein [Gemmatimonadaceae bacterium]|nr:DUF47 family protein [Gemmatimonadaceae bacterium]
MRLIPKDEGFFLLFDGLASKITLSASLLNDLFNDPTRLDHYVGQIKAVERDADDITHEVMTRIDRSFVTPLDREDIHSLATSLDTVVDLMDGTARRAAMFHINESRDHAKALTKLLQRGAEEIAKAVHTIKDSSAVVTNARQMKLIEEEGDAIYANAISSLFADSAANPLEVMKWKEIYDTLEHALDEQEDVMNVLESISIKNS